MQYDTTTLSYNLFTKRICMVALNIPSIGGLILLLLIAYLLLAAPVGNTRSLLVTLINVILVALVAYLLLGWFGLI